MKLLLPLLIALSVIGVLLVGFFWLSRAVDDGPPRIPTPLEQAAEQGDLRTVKRLVAEGASLRAEDTAHGKTPLYFAATADKAEMTRFLIQKGADVNARDDSGETALHEVAYSGHLKVARLLLDHGAAVNLRSHDGSTPLHQAVYLGTEVGVPYNLADHFKTKRRLAALLLDHGADIDARDERGESPAFAAARIGNVPVFDLLLTRGAATAGPFFAGGTLLHAAAMSDEPSIVKRLLLERGMDINARTEEEGMTPLHFAVRWGSQEDNPQMVEFLLQSGADVNARDARGETALDYVGESSGSRVAAALRRDGAKP